ncbi:MAG TPA: hypothetical protein VND98_06200 [Solirubrobacterales bacterium]|nr:hypothetical protein [Solirubrobacterales bacterium]
MTTEQTIKRDQTINAAVKAGKFSTKRTGYWRDQWDKNPAGTERAIALMAGGLTDPPVHVPTENDIVRLFSGQRVDLREPDPPEATAFVREVLGIKGVS